MADEASQPSTTPSFSNEQALDTASMNVVSATPSFGDNELPLERVAVISAVLDKSVDVNIDKKGNVQTPDVVVKSDKKLKLERIQVTSKLKPKPKPKPVIVEKKETVISTGKVKSSVKSSSSDAMTRDSRSGKAKTYTDNKVALDYEAEGKGMAAVVKAAHAGIGSPYVWGGNTPSGWDCSGFVKWAYAKAGINIARGTSAILGSGQFVRTTNPQPGDLIFQNGGGHVGIYIGGGKMIGAQNPTVDTILHSVDRNPLYGYYTLAK